MSPYWNIARSPAGTGYQPIRRRPPKAPATAASIAVRAARTTSGPMPSPSISDDGVVRHAQPALRNQDLVAHVGGPEDEAFRRHALRLKDARRWARTRGLSGPHTSRAASGGDCPPNTR